jgi:hypothetical protein
MVYRRLITLLALVLDFGVSGPGAAFAETSVRQDFDSACGTDLFKEYTPTFRSGDALQGEGVFAIALRPAAGIVLPKQPEEGLATGYGAVVTVEGLAAGRYAIILSREASFEAVQFRPFQALPVTRWTAGANCQVVAEIRVEAGPLTLQFSGVAEPVIMVVVIRLPDDGGYPGRG